MIGTRILHYRIDRKLGEGGMGAVYLATDTKLDRQVALKFLPPHIASDPDFKSRFEHEAKAAAALNHPNIVTIYDLLEHEGQLFIAMEYIDGEPLDKLIRKGDLALEKAVQITDQILEGLNQAHQADIVHRDIKPSNILVTRDDRAKILDFGLAKSRKATAQTKTGTTLGTLQYESPEQVAGKQVDRRSDLFSVGCLLYEMVAGRPPFTGEFEDAIRYSIQHEEPEPLARYKSEVPEGLQNIVAKALTKEPSLRYQHADGMQADVRRFLGDIRQGSSTLRARSGPRRLMLTLIPTAALLLAVLLLKPWRLDVSLDQNAQANENRLAVMYFTNFVDDTDSLRVGETISSLLITDLAETPGLQVVSSQRLYDILRLINREGQKRITSQLATQIAREAQARWILSGNVLQLKPQIILTAELADVESGDIRMSRKVVGEEEDRVFDVVDRLSAEIIQTLRPDASSEQSADRRIADATTHSEEAYRHYLEGVEYSRMLYRIEAENSYRRAVEIDSTFALAYFKWSINHFFAWRGRIDTALLSRAIRHIGHTDKRTHELILAMHDVANSECDSAVDRLTTLSTLYPEDKECLLLLAGVQLFLLLDAESAIQAFRRVIAIDPKAKLAYNYLAYAYNEVDDYENSLWAVNRYLDDWPDEANPYDTRGDLLANQGKLDEAIASYRRALELKPDNPPTLQKLGARYVYKKDYEKAAACFRTNAGSESRFIRRRAREVLTWIPTFQGSFTVALAELDRGIAADEIEYGRDSSGGKHSSKAVIYRELGETELALLEFVKAGRRFYDVARHIQLLCEVGKLIEASTLAQDLRSRTQESNPENACFHWYAMGCLAQAEEDYSGAIAHFEQAASMTTWIGGYSAWVQLALARSYLLAGRYGEAVTSYTRVLNKYPNLWRICIDIVKARYYLAQAYEASGWNAEAIEQYEVFLDIWENADPGLKSVEDAKARLARLKTEL